MDYSYHQQPVSTILTITMLGDIFLFSYNSIAFFFFINVFIRKQF